MNHQWELRNVPIKFQLGDLTLFAPKIRVQVRSVDLMEPASPTSSPKPPVVPLVDDSQGFMIRSLRVQGRLKRLRRVDGYLCYVSSQYVRYHIDLRQPFESYKRQFSAKTRSTIIRKVKKYTEKSGGMINWKLYETPEEMADFILLARQVSAKTYQERFHDAGLPDSEEFRQNMSTLALKGQVRTFILFHREQPVAYLYCPVINDILIYAYLGYDPEYKKMSVGTVLQWLALEHLFKESCFKLFDFTEGESEHKRLFSTHGIQCANVFFLKPNFRNTILFVGHMCMENISDGLGRLLEKLSIKSKVRWVLRNSR